MFAVIANAQTRSNDTTIYLCGLLKDKGEIMVGNKDSASYFDSCPEFPGGDKAIKRFLTKHLKWPNKQLDAQGTVIVDFVIEKNGKLSHITVVRGVTRELNTEAIRVMKLSPRWMPAKLNGKAFRCRYYFPIKFRLHN